MALMTVPKTADMISMGGTDVLSSLATMIVVGRAKAKPTNPPLSHQTRPNKSRLQITKGKVK